MPSQSLPDQVFLIWPSSSLTLDKRLNLSHNTGLNLCGKRITKQILEASVKMLRE